MIFRRLIPLFLAGSTAIAALEAQTATLNFATASAGCINASTYLQSFGIIFVATTPGATAQICGAQGTVVSGSFSMNPPSHQHPYFR